MTRRDLAFGVELEQIVVSPPIASIAPNDTQQFTAAAHYSGGVVVDVTSSATWFSSNGSVAVVDANGLATGVGGGSAKISARLGAQVGSAHIDVSGSPAGLIIFQYVVQQPADGSDFFVDLPSTLSSDIYGVHPEVISGRDVLFEVPDDDPADRTDSHFRVITTAPMDNGDVIEFTVLPG